MVRQSRDDWLQAAFMALAREGAGGLTIDALAARLHVTKGSFYHHFRSVDDFKEKLLHYWEEHGTGRIIELGEATGGGPLTVIDRIIEIAMNTRNDPEVALRAWAMQDETVRSYQTRIDQRRIDYARQMFEQHTGDPARAELMAQLLYCIIVASDQIMPPITGEAFHRLYAEFKRLYGIEQE